MYDGIPIGEDDHPDQSDLAYGIYPAMMGETIIF
jgi:hypothetical protein